MLIVTKDIQAVCKTITPATNLITNLELLAKDGKLNLSVTDQEYYCRCCFDVDQQENFRAVVEAKLFLELIMGITAETFNLVLDTNVLKIIAGRSTYKLPMIFENDKLMELPVINIENKTVEMQISNDILQSIVNVNGLEYKKVKNLSVNELQRLYYITENGAFNFNTGATLNKFKLEKPIKLLLTDKIVKFFKLFKTDVDFSFGYDQLQNGQMQAKIVLESNNIYFAAIVITDDILLSKIQGPCEATQNFINEKYDYNLVLSVNQLSAAISRLLAFTKNSITTTGAFNLIATFNINGADLTITDNLGNLEVLNIENSISYDSSYSFILNLNDLMLILDSCKTDHITLNCGNQRSIIITRGNITHLLPEGQKV